jgi:hypothetical protein
MGTEHSPVCARANSDYSRDAAHKSVAFYETTSFRVQSPISTTRLGSGGAPYVRSIADRSDTG